MNRKATQEAESSTRQRWKFWIDILAAVTGMAASVFSSWTVERVTDRPALMLGVFVGFTALITALTFFVARLRKRDASAQRLKEMVRSAYAEALSAADTGRGGINK